MRLKHVTKFKVILFNNYCKGEKIEFDLSIVSMTIISSGHGSMAVCSAAILQVWVHKFTAVIQSQLFNTYTAVLRLHVVSLKNSFWFNKYFHALNIRSLFLLTVYCYYEINIRIIKTTVLCEKKP